MNITISTPSSPPSSNGLWRRVGIGAGLLAILFGALTLFSGGAVLFGDGQARAAAGDYVPFVLWFNFFAGFAYILAGLGILLKRAWAAKLATLIAATSVLVLIMFGIHILNGGAWEQRTLAAMILRSGVWIVIAALVWRKFGNRRASP